MRVYLAAHYSRKLEVIPAARDLEAMGITVTSTWHRERSAPNVSMKETSESFCRRTAKRDIKELNVADTFILLSMDPDFCFTRGGHCFENGYAWAKGLRTLVVGPRQLVFHYLPGIKRVDTWEQAKRWLKKQVRKEFCGAALHYYSKPLLDSLKRSMLPLLINKKPLPKATGGKRIHFFTLKKLGAKCQSTKRPRETSRSSRKTL